MIVKSAKIKESESPVKAIDMFVGDGFVKAGHGSLADVDIDFPSDKVQEVKDYIKRRYNANGKQRVFSAGTFSTMKAKAVIKDVARTMRIAPSTVNYITAIFEDDKVDYTGIFKLAAENRKVGKFVKDYPMLFEDIRTLMFQPRSSSIHASAVIITPNFREGEDVECFDYVPLKKIDDILVSEDSGYDIDELGLLKNDCLATKELSKLNDVIKLVQEHYDKSVTMESVVESEMDDDAAYSLLRNGYTQNIFQFSSQGITKFLMSAQPRCLEDLIAANALYRPATLESNATKTYTDCKMADKAPTYNWGTYDILKDTYGVCAYQEQMIAMAKNVGGLSLSDGVKLVKFISKKKVDKIRSFKDKFFAGAKKNGCPDEDAEAVWNVIELGGKYAFNKSHSTAYAATAYVGAWMKAYYPTAFYTVALQWAEDKELAAIMSEMEACSSAKVVAPDINHSSNSFFTNYETNEIFWSLEKIKMVGAKAVDWIIEERNKNGEFTSITNFIDRIFKYKLKKYEYWDDPDNEEEVKRCAVNARHVLNLILAGCFDKIENAHSVVERYAIVEKAAAHLGFEIKEKDFPADMIAKHYFWSQKQIAVSGLGTIDYKRIYDVSNAKVEIKHRAAYCTIKDSFNDEKDGKKGSFCATVIEFEEKQFMSKRTGEKETYGKMTLMQNNDVTELMIWPEEYAKVRGKLQDAKGKMVAFMAYIKYSDYSSKNTLSLTRTPIIEVI